MRPADDIRRFIDKAAAGTHSEADKVVLDALLAAHKEARDKASAGTQPGMRSIIMRNPFIKLAAAAVIVAAVILSICVWDKPVPAAYAFEQTLQALHSVRTLHIRDLAPGQSEPKEFWIKCDETGELANVRMHIPAWSSPGDGAKEIVWHTGKAQVWLPAKNIVCTVKEEKGVAQLLEMVTAYDPKGILERVLKLQEQGHAQVQIEQPSNVSEPITVTVTHKGDGQDIQEILTVNQGTRLLESMHRYRLVNGQADYLGGDEFLSYNQPIDPGVFELADLPKDVVRIDETRSDVGLVQGSLTNEQITEKVARTFFEALIAEKYDEADRLLEGAPAGFVKKAFGAIKFIRIISIGPAGPHPIPQTRGLSVPCVVEMEKAGEVKIDTFERLGVRPVGSQPDHWVIFGGI